MGKRIEKRKRLRVDFNTQVKIQLANNHAITAQSADISMNGIFIQAVEKLEVGIPCQVEIILKGASSMLTMQIEGHVVRQGGDRNQGIGIAFNNDLEWWSLFSIYPHYGKAKQRVKV